MTTLTRSDRATLPAGTSDRIVERLWPETSPYVADPDGWATNVLGVESWSKPRQIRESVRDNRHTAVPAAHDVAKSHTAASIACWWEDIHPVGEAFVVTTAPRQHQVDSILWREIRVMHRRGNLRGRVLPSTAKWLMDGDELVAFGRKTADEADPNQAMQAFQGIHSRYVLVIIDEAGGCPDWIFHAADSLAANEHSRVLAIGNPDDPSSHFAEICKPGSKYNVIPVSAFHSPRWSGESVSPRLLEMLVSQTYVDEMAALGEDSHLYQAKVLGQFPDVSSDALFPPALLQRMCDADLPGLAQGGYGGDVARFGDSETVLYRNRGGVIRLAHAARQQSTVETAEQFTGHVSRPAVGALPTYVDADGVGGGVVDAMRAANVPVLEFHGGQAAYDSERFANRRAEIFWTLREDGDAGLVDLDPADKELLTQLGRLRWKLDARGRIKIESKDEMRKRGVKSPDRADGAAMAYAAPPLLNLNEQLDAALEHAQLRGDMGFANLGGAPAPDAFDLSGDILWREM